MKVVLLTDLDNTLYNWVDFFGMSFRGMAHAISRAMKISEEEFVLGARDVFSRVETLEYSFLIQELPFIHKYNTHEIEKFIALSKGVFSRVRKKNLLPYYGVKETLEQLHNKGVIIVAVTNAPRYNGVQRLKQLHLDKYFYGILAWEGKEIPNTKYTKDILEREKAGYYKSKYNLMVWDEPQTNIKPSAKGYMKILEHLGASPKYTYVVGDSLAKDILPALEIGATSIWAKYGTKYQDKNLQTILDITHWEDNQVKNMINEPNINPEYTIGSFSELLDIVQPSQLELFK